MVIRRRDDMVMHRTGLAERTNVPTSCKSVSLVETLRNTSQNTVGYRTFYGQPKSSQCDQGMCSEENLNNFAAPPVRMWMAGRPV